MDLVDIGFLGSERDIVFDFVPHGPEQLVVDQAVNDAVLVGTRLGVSLGVLVQNLFVEQALPESLLGFLIA